MPVTVAQPAPVPESSDEVFELYHGTSETKGQLILKNGFSASTGGQLGPGIYFAKLDKAQRFARDAGERGKGDGTMVIRCRVCQLCFLAQLMRYRSLSKNQSMSLTARMLAIGFLKDMMPSGVTPPKVHLGETVHSDKQLSASSNMEWCIADPKSIPIMSYTLGGGQPWVTVMQ